MFNVVGLEHSKAELFTFRHIIATIDFVLFSSIFKQICH